MMGRQDIFEEATVRGIMDVKKRFKYALLGIFRCSDDVIPEYFCRGFT